MSWAVVAGAGIVGIAGVIGTAISTNSSNDAAEEVAQASGEAADTQSAAAIEAARIQAQSASDAIAEQKRQFDAMQTLMAPWVEQGTDAMGRLGQYEAAGSDALARQRALMGLDGNDAQRAAIEGIAGSAEMAGLVGQGEDALRQQGAATGGLRGGNIQGALAQFRPQMLSSLINQQYSKLGGLIDMGQGITMNRAALGQASAAGTGAAGMQSASSIGNLLMQQGNALAGGVAGAGNAQAQGITNAANATLAAQLANAQAWGQVPNYFAMGGMLGYGMQNKVPKTTTQPEGTF